MTDPFLASPLQALQVLASNNAYYLNRHISQANENHFSSVTADKNAKRLGVRVASDLEEIAFSGGLKNVGRSTELSSDAKIAMMQAHDSEFFLQEDLPIALILPTLP